MGGTLITGGTGFIGAALARRLSERGDALRCLVRKASPRTEQLEELGAELIFGDVHDRSALAQAARGCDTVYHVAGLRCATKRQQLFDVNGEGCRLLADACRQLDSPPTFVLVSSLAAAGPSPRDHRRTEDEIPNPVSNYGRSKLAGEMELREFAAQIPAAIVRPGIVFGPHNEELFPVFQVIRRFAFHVRAGLRTPPVSLIHVEDLIDLMLQVAERGERLAAKNGNHGHGVYHAGDEVCPDWKELGEMIAQSVGRRRVLHCPLFIPVAAAAAGASQLFQMATGKPDVFNIDKIREASAPSWACSSRKAREQLDCQPAAPLQQRLDQTGEWYLQNGWLK